MAGKRHEGGRAGCCDQADGRCVGLAVGRLRHQRLAELAEAIWTASTGGLLPARDVQRAAAHALEVLRPAV